MTAIHINCQNWKDSEFYEFLSLIEKSSEIKWGSGNYPTNFKLNYTRGNLYITEKGLVYGSIRNSREVKLKNTFIKHCNNF